MKATVKWTDGAMFVGESGSGHAVVMDGSPDLGGRNLGPRPMEMLLIGTGGCSTYDVLGMLKKARQQVVDCRVEIEAERADAVDVNPGPFAAHGVDDILVEIIGGEDLHIWVPRLPQPPPAHTLIQGQGGENDTEWICF